MRTDNKLNLVSIIPGEGQSLPKYVHCQPLPYEMIELYHRPLARVFNEIHTQVGPMGGVRVAQFLLKEALNEMVKVEEGAPTLYDEIQRLSQVAYAANGKWNTVALDVAIKREIITLDEWRDVQGEVVNFIVASAIQKKNLLMGVTGAILSAFGAQLTPLDFTGFLASLPKLKAEQDLSTAPLELETAEDTATPSTSTRKKTDYIPS